MVIYHKLEGFGVLVEWSYFSGISPPVNIAVIGGMQVQATSSSSNTTKSLPFLQVWSTGVLNLALEREIDRVYPMYLRSLGRFTPSPKILNERIKVIDLWRNVHRTSSNPRYEPSYITSILNRRTIH